VSDRAEQTLEHCATAFGAMKEITRTMTVITLSLVLFIVGLIAKDPFAVSAARSHS
jgi:hypothetical protein